MSPEIKQPVTNPEKQAQADFPGKVSGHSNGGIDPASGSVNGSTASKMTAVTPSDIDLMPPLLKSLSTLIKLKGKHVSPQFLLAGLSGAEKVSAGACLRAAERAGLRGKVMYRPSLDDISSLTLPCILLTKDGSSLVLTYLNDRTAEIILPENGDMSELADREKIEEIYSGYAVFAALETRADPRSERIGFEKSKRWFFDVLASYAPIYKHAALASLIVNTIAVASSLFVMNVYDRVIPNKAYETLWVLAVGVLIAYLFDLLLKILRSRFVDLAGRNADIVLSAKLVDKVLSMRMDARPESTGALVNNLREFESLREFFGSSTFLAFVDLPFLVIFLFLLWFISGPIVCVPLLAMPLLAVTTLLFQRRAKRDAEKNYRHNMQKNALLTEMVNGLETIKGSMAEARMQRLWESIADISADSSYRSRKTNAASVSFAGFITQAVTVVTVIWGVYRIGAGEMSMGALIGCNILIGRCMAPMMQIASLMGRLQNSRISLKALDMLMELPEENHDAAACMDFGSLPCHFSMDRVTFFYPGSDVPSLDNVSLSIKQGEKVAVIGKMGSGKSTLGKLLIGLYKPKEGQVTFGGVDISQLATADLRSRIGYLPQEVVLFYGTVRDNIALGDPVINDHLIVRAAMLSGAVEYVRRHPAGYGAQVGEQGRNLSGGQRQSIGLARALVRDPDVLILDEPTSNMDGDSEIMLRRRLSSITAGKTIIVITHRMSMLALVDRVIVMDNGKIVMDGPRDKVLADLKKNSSAVSGKPLQVKGGKA